MSSRSGATLNAVANHRRNGTQYSSSKPTSPSHGPTTIVSLPAASRPRSDARRLAWTLASCALMPCRIDRGTSCRTKLTSPLRQPALGFGPVVWSVNGQRVGSVDHERLAALAVDGAEAIERRAPARVDSAVSRVGRPRILTAGQPRPLGQKRPQQPVL